jgi:HAD superfamily hydrolase (TIGR01458 family)
MNRIKKINYSMIKGIILDIDGTLTHDGSAIKGAVDVIANLRKSNFKLRFVTNTTGRSPEQISGQLAQLGFDIYPEEIQTSVTACQHYLSTNLQGKSGYFAVPDVTMPMLKGFVNNDSDPSFVVIGDLDDEFSYEMLNRLFNFVHNGAQLIAFHRNPYYFKEGKTFLDSGAFTRAFEGITNKQAVITGKPSSALFDGAVSSMEVKPEQVVVVGDDVSSDILGAQNANLVSILVGTGKFKPEHLKRGFPQANAFIESLSELIPLFENI